MGNYAKSAHGDYDVRVPSMGQVNYNTVGASAGIASFLGLNAGNVLGGLGWGNNGWGNRNMGAWGAMPHEHFVTRYELGLEKEIAAKDSHIALLEANTYNDQKSLELYRYIDGKLQEQAVKNQAINDSILMVQNEIRLEAEKRCCGDNSIVNYVNATFYPKEVADVTVGTTTTAQTVYNPLPICNCK